MNIIRRHWIVLLIAAALTWFIYKKHLDPNHTSTGII